MAILIPKKREVVPRPVSPYELVNLSHPLAQDLISAHYFLEGDGSNTRSSLDGSLDAVGTSNWSVEGLETHELASDVTLAPSLFSLTSRTFTAFHKINITTWDASNRYFIIGEYEDEGSGFYDGGLYLASADPNGVVFFPVNGSNFSVCDVSELMSDTSSVAVVRHATAEWSVYVNGDLAATSTVSGTTTSIYDWRIGGDWGAAGNEPAHVKHSAALIYGRDLDAGEIRKLHNNPYQILKPKQEYWVMPVAAGGVTPEIVPPLPQLNYRQVGRWTQ